MPFSNDNFEEAEELGRKGGHARSASKARAARQNGRKGGRPPSRTLAERLLGRKLYPDQVTTISKMLMKNEVLFVSEVQTLAEYFGASVTGDVFDTKKWRRKSSRPPRDIRYLIDKFKLGAEYYLRPTKPPKDYVVRTVMPSKEMLEDWERRNYTDNPPCPPRRTKQFLRDLPLFNSLRRLFKDNPNMTPREIEEWGGGKYNGLGQAILDHLRFPKPPKDYIHVRFPPSPARLEKWEQKHGPDEPYLGRKRRIYFKTRDNYTQIVRAFRNDPEMTCDDVIAIGGPSWGYSVASDLLTYLRHRYQK